VSDTTVYTLYPEVEADERGRYFDGQFLTAQDFVDEQRYHSDRLRRVLDLLTVAGVAKGLELTATGAWLLRLGPGTAIDERGRLLVVPSVREGIPVPRDLPGGAADVSLFYAEVESRVQGGSSEEEGTRGATRLREVPTLEFHAVGVAPSHVGAVRLGRLSVDAKGTITLDPSPGLRVSAGLRLPAEPDGGPTLRSGGRARPNLLQGTGDLAVTGKLAVGTLDPEAALDVRGLARVDDLSVREHNFRVEGDEAQFYPVVFRDLDWTAGAAVLEISRPNAQTDAANAGSLLARLRWHASDGHGSDLLDCELVQTRRFVAAARPLVKDRLLAVWLRGNRSYAWRASQRCELVDAKAGAKTLGTENLSPRADIDPTFDRDRVALGVTFNQIELRSPVAVAGSLAVTGDLAYSGTQLRLNVAEQAAATIRASDFTFGHSTRRGQPGRALVDEGSALTVNYAGDWPTTRLGGATTEVQGDLKGLKTLTITGVAAITGNLSTAGTLTADGDATFKKATTVGTSLTVTGDAALKKNVAVTGTLAVDGAVTLKAALGLEGNLNLINADPNLLVRRKSGAATGGTKIFLDLHQDDANPATVPEVGVALRFQHGYRYWHRIEADANGLHVRDGDPASKAYRALFVGNLSTAGTATIGTGLTVTGDAALKKNLAVGGTLTLDGAATLKGNVTVASADPFLQVQRNAGAATGGTKIFLECIQEDASPTTVPEVGAALRFHHRNRYWHRLEADGNGLHVRDGDPGNTNYKPLYAGNLFSNGMNVTTGTSERLRTIRGTVAADGSVVAGAGFSISKSGNLWKITFADSFSGNPTVVVTQQYPDNNNASDSGNTKDNAIVVAVKSSEAYIKTGDNDGSQSWRRFHFIAIGTY
jgi:predicted acyltransferase (DUF342 family)